MTKTLDQISWLVTEKEYRQDPALSYSTLAKYERTGFNELPHLFDHVSTPSLLLGSCVDTLVTGSMEEFNELFFVADFPSLGDKEKMIADTLFNQYFSIYQDFVSIPFNIVLDAASAVSFQGNWKEETKVKVLRERCSEYYRLLGLAQGKTVVSAQMYADAMNMVRALKTSYATSGYFAENVPGSTVQRYYQLKFKHMFDGVPYRNMADLIIVDYEDKTIQPIDLKTSFHAEWDFQESFVQWKYMIQAFLYHSIIRACMDEDEYFKDFKLDDYRFIVVNKNTLTPLIWKFPYTTCKEDLVDDNGNVYRNPFTIGKELYQYLLNKPQVPDGINLYGDNIITCLHPIVKNDISTLAHLVTSYNTVNSESD